MKILTSAFILLISSVSWSAGDVCAPMTSDTGHSKNEQVNIERTALLNFTLDFANFRREHLKDTSLCKDKIHFSTFEHDVDFASMSGSTVYINSAILKEMAQAILSENTSQESKDNLQTATNSLMGVMTYFSYSNASKVKWYKAEAMAAIGFTGALGDYNREIATRMAAEKPLMALGLGIYRVVTFERIPEEKRARKQDTHATPYQIAEALVSNGELGMARELLELAHEKNYVLKDNSKVAEMTLEMLSEIEDSLQ